MAMAVRSTAFVFHWVCAGVCLQLLSAASGTQSEDNHLSRNLPRSAPSTSQLAYDVYTNELQPCELTIPHLSLTHKLMPTEYKIDTALLYVISSVDFDVVYMWQHGDCYECPLFEMSLGQRSSQYNCSQRIQTRYPNVIQVDSNNGSCALRKRLTDKGVYQLNITTSGQGILCDLQPLNSPSNPDLPMLYAFLIYLLLAAVWVLLVFLYRKGKFDKVLHRVRPNKIEDVGKENGKDVEIRNDPPSDIGKDEFRLTYAKDNGSADGPAADEAGKKDAEQRSESPTLKDATVVPENIPPPPVVIQKVKQRLRSLDALRGVSLVVMIFVNYGSAGYYYIEHAIWNGLTVGDLVFPWFIFMMGTSMVFSFRGLFKRNTPNLQIVWKIVWRSVLLFAMGLFLSTKYENDMEWIRIPGVLQRFSVTYLVTALVHFAFAKRSYKKKKNVVGDIFYYWPEWIIMLALLGLHLALTFALPVPGCPIGYLGPGGLANNASYFNCTGGAAGYIDKKILSIQHIYRTPTIMDVYYTTEPFDPEGILGTLTSIFLCFLGLQAGKIIDMHKNHMPILIRWSIWGVVTGLIALLLCNAKQDGGWIPLNKNLWSVSYVLAMASTGFIALSILYILIDVFNIWNGAPFIYPGMNSIVIYFCQSSFSTNFPVSWQMPDEDEHWQLLIVDCWSASVWTFVAYILYRKKIFVAL